MSDAWRRFVNNMIGKIAPPAEVTHLYRRFLEALHSSGFEGQIAADHANRTVLATDNSIYQRLPQAAVYPHHVEDVVKIAALARQPEFKQIVLTPRGGGTGTNGQSLTHGVVVDLSRHLNQVLEINVGERWVRVQSGVVKDQLNAALRRHGLFFAPELSTSNRATIGGMINTDASGQGSCTYGKTRDHVLELDTVLLDGTLLHSLPVSEDELSVCERLNVGEATAKSLSGLSKEQRERGVILVQDAFTRYFDTQVVVDWIELIHFLGYTAYIVPFRPNGKPLHVLGFLGSFEKAAQVNARHLSELSSYGMPMIGLDPAMTLVYRQEYQKLDGERMQGTVLLPQEWLSGLVLPMAVSATTATESNNLYSLLAHCTEKTNAPASTAMWPAIFKAVGLALDVRPSGCCGMSGTYGHEVKNLETSKKIFALSWAPALKDMAGTGQVLANGYSCRCQASRLAGAQLEHPVQTLLRHYTALNNLA
ncbi:hypothetical protein AN901_203447 [Pseudomonas syringae pv. theae]|uniref:Oxidase n=1 Tax=Pseudomonas syringae pv. theae TaxID=103985 RepID=A0A0Q0E7S9_PSESX|nr:hypothetical protein AN901_203447 [Pseudomonas syringae pv. theae]RMT63256.1 Oxidase [Pseudomonas syringae pv. theae]